MFFKYSCQKTLKHFFGRPVFLEEFQAAINFSKVSLHFNKIPNSFSFTDIFRKMHFLCTTKKVLQDKFYRYIQKNAFFVYRKESPPEAVSDN